MHPIVQTANELATTTDLINRFPIKSGTKTRWVNDPIPQLKQALKEWNQELTAYYENVLQQEQLTLYAQAYLPNKSIKTNAKIHQNSSTIIKFDFSGFYDSVHFDYIKSHIKALTEASDDELLLIERLIIDPETNGVTQGLPVSGALAGLALVPFWSQLRKNLHKDIQFTQYSDDLTFSKQSRQAEPYFTKEALTTIIKQTLAETDRDFVLNDGKTTVQSQQFRKITGVRINHNNQLSCSRKDYRLFRTMIHVLSKESDTESVLKQFGFKSVASFTGKISYMRSIDETGKIDKLIERNSEILLHHGLFRTWISERISVFG